jgi:predicted dienelactone hydrolase
MRSRGSVKSEASEKKNLVPGSLTFLFSLLSFLFALTPSLHGEGAAAIRFENLVPATTASIELPTPTGPWPVGTVTFHWTDPARTDLLVPGRHHQVIAQTWYPADREKPGEPAVYFPGLDLFRAGLTTIPGGRPAEDSKRLAAFGGVVMTATSGPPIAPDTGRLPVLLFSPGGNMSRHYHSTLAMDLASHGYLVVVMSHKYSTWDVFPAGGFALSRDWFGDEDDPEAERLTNYLAADAAFVLDALTALDANDAASRFTKRIDLDRIAVVGHSRGGKTVARACSSDPRVLACVTMDNIGPAAETATGLRKPQLMLRSDDSDAWPDERLEELHAFLQRNTTTAREVVLRGGGHNDFSDLPIVDVEVFGSKLDQRESQRCIATVVLDFVSVHLKSPRGSRLDVDGDCPSIEVREHARHN